MRYILNHIALLGSKKMRGEKRRKFWRNFSLLRTLVVVRLCRRFPKELKISENFVLGWGHCRRSTHTISTLWDVPKQPICYTEQFRIKKGKFSFSFVCWDAEGLWNVLPRRDSLKAAVFIWRRFSRCNLRITLEIANKRVGEITPQPCTANSSSFGEHFFSYLLCLTQHLFLVGHGCNLRGVLRREIKSVISAGKQAFW